MRFNHIGIPTTRSFDGEIHLPHLKMTVSDHQDNPFGIHSGRFAPRRVVAKARLIPSTVRDYLGPGGAQAGGSGLAG